MPNNLIMIDHAHNDKRSIAAMLSGKGDGREQEYLGLQKRHPEMDTLELIDYFTHECRYGRIGHERSLLKLIRKNYLLTLGIVLFLVF